MLYGRNRVGGSCFTSDSENLIITDVIIENTRTKPVVVQNAEKPLRECSHWFHILRPSPQVPPPVMTDAPPFASDRRLSSR
jgi:hypothetical protein